MNPPPDPHAAPNPYAAPDPYAGPSPYAGPNPYAPPAAPYVDPSTVAPVVGLPVTTRLFNANHVALATFLGSALGGALLMTINEHRMRRQSAAAGTLLLGLLASGVLLAIAFALPEGAPSLPLGFVPLVVMRLVAEKRQGHLVRYHQSVGSPPASGWAAAGIGLAALVVVMVPTIVIAVVIELAKGDAAP